MDDLMRQIKLIRQIKDFAAVDWPAELIGGHRHVVQMESRREQIVALIRDVFTEDELAAAISLFCQAIDEEC